jgi:hypothetical protein
MFLQKRYQCCTINEVRSEIFRIQRFKMKYSWRMDYKDKIRCLPNELSANEEVRNYYDAITALIEIGTINRKTGRDFDLSHIDRRILACTLANSFRLTSGDGDLKQFALQEFGKEFKGDISPLGMINKWLREGILKWTNERHRYLADWDRDEEHAQPKNQISQFKKLTGRKYPGS